MTFTTRPATASDYASFEALFGELGVPDPTPSATAFEAMLPRVVVAEHEGRVVGYAIWRIYGGLAHIVNVVAAPDVRGRGVGRALMDALRDGIRADGVRRWYLNVKRDNVPAIALYRAFGFEDAGPVWATEGTWSMVARLPAPTITTRVDTRAEPDELVALGLYPDQIAFLRERGRLIRGLRDDDGALVAFAVFDPHYPGAYPFAARDVPLARALLEALAPHADPAQGDLVRVAVESDHALAEALVAVGAKFLFPLERMHGDIA